MADKLKPMSKAWYARNQRHRHNGFLGCAAMMKANCNSILESMTATSEAKKIAMEIHELAVRLGSALKKRVPGT